MIEKARKFSLVNTEKDMNNLLSLCRVAFLWSRICDYLVLNKREGQICKWNSLTYMVKLPGCIIKLIKMFSVGISSASSTSSAC